MALNASPGLSPDAAGEAEKDQSQWPPTSARITGSDEESTPATRPERALQKWNEPKISTYRFFVTLYSFIIMGMNSAALGVRFCNPNIVLPLDSQLSLSIR